MRDPILLLIFLAGFATALPVQIPFRLYRGMILVDGTMKGSTGPMQFILDSGAGDTVLARRTATALGLALTTGERVRTVHGVESASRAESTLIRLGNTGSSLSFTPTPLVLDLDRESRILGSPIDGLLGSDFFRGRSIKIDFAHSRLHISPGGKPGKQSIQLPLTQGEGAMFVELTAGDTTLRRVRLDTGCCRSLCWSPAQGSSHHGRWRDGKTLKMAVKFGTLIVPDVPTDVYQRPLFSGEDGLLGSALLSRFDAVWIDAIRNRIIFEPAAD